jgi:hypothetical protein
MISIVQQPQKYSPVNNPQIFQIKSDRLYFAYFQVKVLKSDNTVIAYQKFNPLPSLPDGSVFDLSSILSNLVDNQIVNTTNIIEPVNQMLTSYKLEITEWYQGTTTTGGALPLVIPNGIVQSGSTFTTSLYNVWNADLQRTKLTNYNSTDYVVSSGSTQAKFLTNKPLVSNIYKNNIEYLYLLNDGTTSFVKFDFYGAGHEHLGSHSLSGITSSNKAYRINIDSSILGTYFGDDFNNLYGDQFDMMFDLPFGDYYDVNSSNYFTVQIVNASGNSKSELRTYILKSLTCLSSFQLFFSNNLSGIDNIQLFNPKESISNSKTSFKSYQYKLNEGSHSDVIGGIYNSINRTITSNTISSYKAITGVLSDENARWIKDIINASEVYVRIENGFFLPVSLSTTSYNIQSRKYSTNNNRLELEFTSTESGLFD